MAYTQEQLIALDAAIAQGANKVKYGDKEIEFRSLNDMLKLRDTIQQELNPPRKNSNRKFGEFNKGL